MKINSGFFLGIISILLTGCISNNINDEPIRYYALPYIESNTAKSSAQKIDKFLKVALPHFSTQHNTKKDQKEDGRIEEKMRCSTNLWGDQCLFCDTFMIYCLDK